MLRKLLHVLKDAEGQSEFVISVFCDIRKFTEFSKGMEAPDIGMFIKRFYIKLIKDYFDKVTYVKPAGDGLLMIFQYNEKNLIDISKYIIDSCFKCLEDFPDMFKDDPLINFPTPKGLGFGITRGTAFCLTSNRQTIDYSGRLLNLSARLMDLARPQGIVIDGNYLMGIIPEDRRGDFVEDKAFLRGISEDTPFVVYRNKDVVLPDYARHPLKVYNWEKTNKNILAKDVLKLVGTFSLKLPKNAISKDKIIIGFSYPTPKMKGYTSTLSIREFTYREGADEPTVTFDLTLAKSTIKKYNIKPNIKISFNIEYVPKP